MATYSNIESNRGVSLSNNILTGDKSPLVALILNFCIFGFIGYIYLGQWQKGLVMLAIWVLSLGTLGTIAWIISLIDVYLQAKIMQEGRAIEQWTFFNNEAG